MADDDLRARIAEALRGAPVHATVMRLDVLTDVYGPVDALADAVMAIVQPEPATEQTDRCARCWCGDCGGRLDEHTESGCGCESCTISPNLACKLAEFLPDEGIAFIAEQLGPLLSTHLGPRQQQRCLAVAHAANHALRDYDHRMETGRAADA